MGDLDANYEIQQLVGRKDVLTAVLRSLGPANGAGAIVVGSPGLGKTAIADTVQAVLRHIQPTFRISGSASLSAVPYGALAPYISSLPVTEIGSPLAVLHAMMDVLEQTGPGSNTPVLIVDDAHDLDDASVSVIAQIVVAGSAQLLAFASPDQGVPGEIASLWSDGLLARFDLDPLSEEEVHELCGQLLGGNVLRSVSVVLARSSAGNPLFLRALIDQGKRSGHLVERNGAWFFTGDPPAADLELADVVKARMLSLNAQEREALELVALAEPLELSVLLQTCPAAVVDALEHQRLIEIADGEAGTVRSAHPLYGEVIRSYMPTGRKLAARQRIIELLDDNPVTVDGLLRYVGWALDCRAPVPDSQLIRAARVANDLLDPAFALRAARAVNDPAFQMASQGQMAQAYYARGDLRHAAELLEPVMERATDFRTLAAAALLSSRLRMHRGGAPSEVEQDARAWREAIGRLSDGSTDPKLLRAAAVSRIGSRLLSLRALNLAGNYGPGEAELRLLASEPAGTPETRLVALSLLAETLAATGRPETGTGLSAQALELFEIHEQQSYSYFDLVVSRYATSLINAGRWDEVHDLMTQYLEHTQQGIVYHGGLVNLTTGRVLVRQGLLHSALNQLRPAIEVLSEADPEQVLPLALGLGAYAAAMIGERDQARQYLADFGAVAYAGERQFHLLGKAHAAAAKAVLPGGADGVGQLRTIANEAVESGIISAEQLTRELQIRVGDLSALERQAALAAGNEGIEARIQHDFAAALLDRDPDRLVRTAHSAGEGRYFLIQVDCLLHASALFISRGDRRKARYVAQLIDDNPAIREGAITRNVRSSDSVAQLTRRERDIASHAVDGQTNREIAEVLGVSARTVEGHLYRIFAKLGIDRREDLRRFHISSGD
ncbi:LuxR family transcriptional regulator [Arthrobacter pigmenti]